jgi:hypothetical protein
LGNQSQLSAAVSLTSIILELQCLEATVAVTLEERNGDASSICYTAWESLNPTVEFVQFV